MLGAPTLTTAEPAEVFVCTVRYMPIAVVPEGIAIFGVANCLLIAPMIATPLLVASLLDIAKV